MPFSVSAGICSLPIYPVQSEEQVLHKYGLSRLIKMASNENCYGASPLAVQAIENALREVHRYPEVYAAPLKSKLGESLHVDPSQVVVGNGSTEVIEMIASTFLQQGEKCLTAYETFPIYRMAVAAVNGVCVPVPLRSNHYDLESLLVAIDSETRLIFIANPNNPTGTYLSQKDIQRFVQRVPSNVLVVIDEAYREYAPERSNSVGYISAHPNLIVLRTFSKVYGLAGLRVGYAVCSPEVAGYLNRAAFPYGVNLIAQIAAIAALEDQNHVNECVEKNLQERERLQREFSARGYAFVPSHANFILLKISDPPALYEALLKKGILVAPVPHFHVPDGVRITLGTPEENGALLDAL